MRLHPSVDGSVPSCQPCTMRSSGRLTGRIDDCRGGHPVPEVELGCHQATRLRPIRTRALESHGRLLVDSGCPEHLLAKVLVCPMWTNSNEISHPPGKDQHGFQIFLDGLQPERRTVSHPSSAPSYRRMKWFQ